jgi:hypothetical protein
MPSEVAKSSPATAVAPADRVRARTARPTTRVLPAKSSAWTTRAKSVSSTPRRAPRERRNEYSGGQWTSGAVCPVQKLVQT